MSRRRAWLRSAELFVVVLTFVALFVIALAYVSGVPLRQLVSQWYPSIRAVLGWLVIYLTAICSTALVFIIARAATLRRNRRLAMERSDTVADHSPGRQTTFWAITDGHKRWLLAAFALWLSLVPAYFVLPQPPGTVPQRGISPHRSLNFPQYSEFPKHSDFGELMYHPYLQSCWRPGSPGVNSHGFLGQEIRREKPPGVYRIFLVGGSTVADLNIPLDGERVLEKMLQQQGADHVELINAATDGHTSQHSLIKYLVNIKDYDPDLIIIWHGINDLRMSVAGYGLANTTYEDYGAYKNDYSHFYGPMKRIVSQHFAADKELWRDDAQEPSSDLVQGYKEFGFPSIAPYPRNIESLVEATQADHVDLVLATQPSIYRPNMSANEIASLRGVIEGVGRQEDVDVLSRGMEEINECTRQVAEEHDVYFLDLASMVPKDREYFYDDVHYTPRGIRLVSRRLVEFLIDKDLLKAFDASDDRDR